MTISEKIKYIRQFRNIPQKELGISMGFPTGSAVVRICQFENGTRSPRENLVEKFAQVMYVSKICLLDNIENKVANIIMQMFWTEIEMKLYVENSKIPSCRKSILLYNRATLDLVNHNIKESNTHEDLLSRAIFEYQEYRQSVFTGIISYEEFIDIMLNWDITSAVGKEIYKK